VPLAETGALDQARSAARVPDRRSIATPQSPRWSAASSWLSPPGLARQWVAMVRECHGPRRLDGPSGHRWPNRSRELDAVHLYKEVPLPGFESPNTPAKKFSVRSWYPATP
jgi:hypothetical protein